MEFSSFSTGTEHAVKTWQAAIGTHEDGNMTAELLERLYMKQQFEDGGTNLSADQEATTTFPQVRWFAVVCGCCLYSVFVSLSPLFVLLVAFAFYNIGAIQKNCVFYFCYILLNCLLDITNSCSS